MCFYEVWPESDEYICVCSCLSPEFPSSQAELEVYKLQTKEKIVRQLHVDTTTLSSTVRRKSSAEDQRPSAQSVGYLGVMLMALCFSFIFALDISNVWTRGHSLCSCVKKTKLT
ncbi:hypothetical protein EGW08_004620 [Elysia chlorotica]|uniref:Uncharacterized protein n=1 Tax=Elysia chlorotica TaxID=188477 RepID=A0A433U1G0_ELYCH|nr:hypothetical protein EGW08_004620 [Elysia chlorotica]